MIQKKILKFLKKIGFLLFIILFSLIFSIIFFSCGIDSIFIKKNIEKKNYNKLIQEIDNKINSFNFYDKQYLLLLKGIIFERQKKYSEAINVYKLQKKYKVYSQKRIEIILKYYYKDKANKDNASKANDYKNQVINVNDKAYKNNASKEKNYKNQIVNVKDNIAFKEIEKQIYKFISNNKINKIIKTEFTYFLKNPLFYFNFYYKKLDSKSIEEITNIKKIILDSLFVNNEYNRINYKDFSNSQLSKYFFYAGIFSIISHDKDFLRYFFYSFKYGNMYYYSIFSSIILNNILKDVCYEDLKIEIFDINYKYKDYKDINFKDKNYADKDYEDRNYENKNFKNTDYKDIDYKDVNYKEINDKNKKIILNELLNLFHEDAYNLYAIKNLIFFNYSSFKENGEKNYILFQKKYLKLFNSIVNIYFNENPFNKLAFEDNKVKLKNIKNNAKILFHLSSKFMDSGLDIEYLRTLFYIRDIIPLYSYVNLPIVDFYLKNEDFAKAILYTEQIFNERFLNQNILLNYSDESKYYNKNKYYSNKNKYFSNKNEYDYEYDEIKKGFVNFNYKYFNLIKKDLMNFNDFSKNNIGIVNKIFKIVVDDTLNNSNYKNNNKFKNKFKTSLKILNDKNYYNFFKYLKIMYPLNYEDLIDNSLNIASQLNNSINDSLNNNSINNSSDINDFYVSKKFNVFDKLLILSLIRVESHFNKMAISEDGAKGLTQILPATASWIFHKNTRYSKKYEKELFKPDIAIKGAIKYIYFLYDKFNSLILALASYNAGYKRIERNFKNKYNKNYSLFYNIEKMNIQETNLFLKKIVRNFILYNFIYEQKEFLQTYYLVEIYWK